MCQYFHIETAENSFGYIAGWSQGKELKELRDSLETINQAASELITDMEHHIGQICKERGIDLTPEVEGLLSGQDLESLYLVNDSTFLHVQKVDTGWDYTLYDKDTLRLVGGGLMEDEVIAESPIVRPIAAARTEIMVLEGIQPEKVVFWDFAYLEELQAAQNQFTAQAVQDYADEVRQRCVDVPPDPTISVEHMHDCGFKDLDMLPISEDRAKELADRGISVYQLFEDGTKYRVDDPIDITVFGGLYGITKQEWDRVRLDIPPRDIERRFMERPEPVMAVYQLKETALHELLFESFDRLDAPPARENYDCIYVRDVDAHLPVRDVLDLQFQIYNIDRPDDFTGHSLSVSDIVALKRDGEISYHYVDTFGFREIPGFQNAENYLKSAEMTMELNFQNYLPFGLYKSIFDQLEEGDEDSNDGERLGAWLLGDQEETSTRYKEIIIELYKDVEQSGEDYLNPDNILGQLAIRFYESMHPGFVEQLVRNTMKELCVEIAEDDTLIADLIDE